MFRSTIIIRELVLNLAKVIFMLKYSVKLRRYMLFGDMAGYNRAACVLCAVHTAPYHLHVSIVLKSGSLNLLEPSRTVQACTRIALPLLYPVFFLSVLPLESLSKISKLLLFSQI